MTDSTTSLPKVGETVRPIGLASSMGTVTYDANIASLCAFSALAFTNES